MKTRGRSWEGHGRGRSGGETRKSGGGIKTKWGKEKSMFVRMKRSMHRDNEERR